MSGLAVSRLSAGYGSIRVLHEISLAVRPGEIVTIVGGNGAGKTTLLKTVAGVLRPWQGQIALGDEEIPGHGSA